MVRTNNGPIDNLHEVVIDIGVGCNCIQEFVAGYEASNEASETRELPGDELLWLVRRFLPEIARAEAQARALRDGQTRSAALFTPLLSNLEGIRSGIEFVGAFAAIKREGMEGDAVVPAIADVLWLTAKIDRHAIDALAAADNLAYSAGEPVPAKLAA